MDLLQLLRRSRREVREEIPVNAVAKCLPRVNVFLDRILDRDQELLQGHVVMGFTREGDYLLSYKLVVDYDGDDMGGMSHLYSIHWWKFSIFKPLYQVWSVSVFKGYSITESLRLLICQPSSQPYFLTVFGYNPCSTVGSDSYTCYVSIVPSPLTPPEMSHTSLHITYQLFPPFPFFRPSLCLAIENCVLINSGCGLYAVSYSTQDSVDSRQSEDSWCSCVEQLFINDSYTDGTSHSKSTDFSLTMRLLQLEVYWKDTPLSLCGESSSSCSCRSNGASVWVCQRSVDIEQWLYHQLPVIVAATSNHGNRSLHSIADYDLQLIEVFNTECVIVVFMVVVVAEISCTVIPSLNEYYSINLSASWNVKSGVVDLISHSKPVISEYSPTHPVTPSWNPASSIVSKLQSKLRPCHTSFMSHVQVFSNHTVLTGKSVSSLHHPYLPLTLKLTTGYGR